MSRLAASIGVAFALALGLGSREVAAGAQPDGQLTVAFDVSIALTFLDPAETPGIGVPFVFLYALHDALIKPLPGNDTAPCLAESWTESADGLVYEFKLRERLKFHNGDSFTAEDVKFSFLRYRGTSAKLLHDRVKAVDIVDRIASASSSTRRGPTFSCSMPARPQARRGSCPRNTSRRSAKRDSDASLWASGPIASRA